MKLHKINNIFFKVFLFVVFIIGCNDNNKNNTLDELTKRVNELEHLNGQQSVRIQEMENDIFLLTDRIDATQLAIQRRRDPRELPVVRLERKNISPKKEIYPKSRQTQNRVSQHENRDVLVLTELEMNDFINQEGYSRSRSKHDGDNKVLRKRVPKAPVVLDEKLPVVPMENGGDKVSTTQSPLTLYKSALTLYEKGKLEQALLEFQRFMSLNPPVEYVDNALYWIGDCQYGLNDFDQAKDTLKTLINDYPSGNKVPDAMLKLGLTYDKLSDNRSAKKILNHLIHTYPATEAAKKSKKKLRNLR